MFGAWGGAGARVEVRLAAEMKGYVLLGYQAGADAGAEMLIEEARHFGRGDVLATLEKPPSENGDGVGVGLD